MPLATAKVKKQFKSNGYMPIIIISYNPVDFFKMLSGKADNNCPIG